MYLLIHIHTCFYFKMGTQKRLQANDLARVSCLWEVYRMQCLLLMSLLE